MVWLSGNSVRHINEVILRRARLVLGLVTTLGGLPPRYYPGHSGPLIPPWVSAMSTRDGFGHLWEEIAPPKLRPVGAL